MIEWLNQLYNVPQNTMEHDHSIDLIFNNVDDLLLDGKLDDVDSILDEVNVDKLDISQMLSFLTVTLCADIELKRRVDFYIKVRDRIRLIDPSRECSLLSGLEKL